MSVEQKDEQIEKTSSALRQWMNNILARSMGDWTRYIKNSGISMPQFVILMALSHKGSAGVHDIGKHMEISSAAASQIIDRLVQSGFVDRMEDPQDRRVKHVTLTNKGRAAIKAGMDRLFHWVEELAENLTDEERRVVLKALPILMEAETKIPREAVTERNKKDEPTTLTMDRSELC
jgi:DNA-binding MarR family transcriptional regulator